MALAVESFWRRLRYTPLRGVLRGQLNGQLDWQRVVVEADLPIEIADMVSKVVLKSRLWMGERFDVAQELVAHFLDGLEAGVSREELLASFGDAAGAAKLIRRSKRRGRPLVWQAWWWGCWGLVGLSIAYAVAIPFLIFGRPSIDTDYLAKLNEQAAKVGVEDRAWPYYREALLQLGYRDGKSPSQLSGAIDAHPGDDNWEILREYLASNEAGLEKLRNATKKSHLGFQLSFATAEKDLPLFSKVSAPAADSYQGPHPDIIQIRLPQLGPQHSAIKLLAADVYRAADNNDAATAAEDVAAMLGMIEHVEESPFLASGGWALAMRSIAYDTVANMLREHRELWSDAQLGQIAHQLAATAKIAANDRTSAARIWFYDFVQRIYTDDGNGDGRPTAQGLIKLREMNEQINGMNDHRDSVSWLLPRGALVNAALPMANLLYASRRDLVAEYDRLMDLAESLFAQPLWPIGENDKWMAYRREIRRTLQQDTRYMLIGMTMPAVDLAVFNMHQKLGQCDGVLIGIALELYRREFGEWPGSLERLSPGWLPGVPVDRLSGGALGYRIVEGQPIVYSVGVDGDDDQGRPPMVYGTPTPLNAAPNDVLSNNRPLRTNPHYDGDWVIWSTVEGDAE